MVNHAVAKGLLFMTAGSVEYATGIRDLKKLGGLARKMPVTSSTSFSGSMTISGLPPFSGFFSKLVIIIAAIKAHYFVIAFLAAGMSIVTLAYFLRLQKGLFAAKPMAAIEKIKEVPFAMTFSMVCLAIGCIALSALIFPGVREAIITPAVKVLMDVSNQPLTIK
jgi:multicomponent Na+:H+ antiporter subunit D